MLETTNKTKILVQAWPLATASVNRHLRGIHVKRDSYLNSLLTQEIERLADEIDFETPSDARTKIKRRLRDLEPTPMTIVLDRRLVERMDIVLRERNISRNAFINRVLFFLVVKPVFLDRLNIAYVRSTECLVKPLDDAGSSLFNPFYNIRDANDWQFYSLFIQEEPIAENWPSLFGLNCAIKADSWRLMNMTLPDLDDIV
jgi:hypothetical protein